MATATTRLGLTKPGLTDTVDPVSQIGDNMQKIDDGVSLVGHAHTGAVGDGPQIQASGLADSAATDAKIGNRTVSDVTAPTGDTGLLTALFGGIAYMIKAITGKASWRTAPATTLEAAKGHMDATAPHSGHETPTGAQTKVNTHAGATAAGTHGSASAATANTLMHRDAAGRAKVAAPSAADDIARKDTVDTVQTNLTNHSGATVAGTHGSTAAATANTLMHRDAAGRAKVAAPSAADDIARKDTVDGLKTVANTFTQRQTFQAGIQDGDNNTDTSLLYSLGIPVDTRSWTATTWNAANKPTHIDVQSGATVVATLDIAYNAANKPTQVVVAGGGKTITYTITWTNNTKLNGITKAVV